MNNPNRPGGGVKPDADDIESFQRERRTRMVDRIGDVPNVASEGGGGGGSAGWLAWAIIAILLAGGYYLYQQLDLARAQLTLDQQRILRLEKQLNITDESVTESSDQMQKQVQFLDTEIRKLWDNVWKKSKEQLNEHEERLTKFEKTLEGLKTRIATSIEEALADAQIAVTTTPSREPLIHESMLHPGLHITAMGADAEHKNELAPNVIAEADLFVCDKHEQSARLGELHHAVGAGVVPEDMPVTELGDLVAGTKPGRQSDEAITVCDLTGTGAQDTAIATYALAVALENSFGTRITN